MHSPDNSTVSISLRSAGTLSPVDSKTRSPTTISLAERLSIALPSLKTVQVCGTKSESASRALSDLYSWTAATSETIVSARAIEIASAWFPCRERT